MKDLKLRWTNGWGDDMGNQIPFHYWIESSNGDIELDTDNVENFMKENNVCRKDFRGYRERELTQKLYDELVFGK